MVTKWRISPDVIKFARNSLLYCEDKPLMIVDRAP